MTEFSRYHYGYWINDKGDLIEATRSHAASILKHLKTNPAAMEAFGESGFEIDQQMELVLFGVYKLGWIRIHLGTERTVEDIQIQIGNNSVAPKAYQRLKQILTDEPFRAFFLEVSGYEDFTYRDFKKCLSEVREHVKKGSMVQAAGEDYGYWITDKGDLIELSYEEHNSKADKYVFQNYYKEYLQYVQTVGTASSLSFVMQRLGWIRLVNEGKTLSIEIVENTLSQKAYNRFTKFIRESNYLLYTLEINKSANSGSSYIRYDTEENRSAVNRMLLKLKENIDRSRHVQIEGSLGMEAVLAKTASYIEKRSPHFTIKAKVHTDVLASEAAKRLTRYMRRKNGKKV